MQVLRYKSLNGDDTSITVDKANNCVIINGDVYSGEQYVRVISTALPRYSDNINNDIPIESNISRDEYKNLVAGILRIAFMEKNIKYF